MSCRSHVLGTGRLGGLDRRRRLQTEVCCSVRDSLSRGAWDRCHQDVIASAAPDHRLYRIRHPATSAFERRGSQQQHAERGGPSCGLPAFRGRRHASPNTPPQRHGVQGGAGRGADGGSPIGTGRRRRRRCSRGRWPATSSTCLEQACREDCACGRPFCIPEGVRCCRSAGCTCHAAFAALLSHLLTLLGCWHASITSCPALQPITGPAIVAHTVQPWSKLRHTLLAPAPNQAGRRGCRLHPAC